MTQIYLLIIIIILFLGITYIYWGNTSINKNLLSQYIISLSIIGIIIGFFTFFYNNYYNNENIKINDINIMIHNLENSFLELEKNFMDNYPYSTELYQQIYNNCKYINN